MHSLKSTQLRKYLAFSLLFWGMFLFSVSKSSGQIQMEGGGPENAAAKLILSPDNKAMSLVYDGATIFSAQFDKGATVSSSLEGNNALTQTVKIQLKGGKGFHGVVHASKEALAAETQGRAQQEFALVRTSHGLSDNLRNDAIYDRFKDWMLQTPEGTVIQSHRNIDGLTRFEVVFNSNTIELKFYPHYYQKHKNLPYFKPWTYSVYKAPVTGWSSWWAYFRNFNEKDQDTLLAVWKKKHFADYGYRFIQIDDVYQGENDRGRENNKESRGYFGGRPTTWLDWKKDLFPGGLTHYVNSVHAAGFNPAVWIGCFFSDTKTAKEHPDWFVTDSAGVPVSAPWIGYTMDATNPVVAETLIRPVFKGLKNAGVDYVKIDQLRHYLYDCLDNHLDWCKKRGVTPAEVVRAYMVIAREELGDDTFILACWGVLPEMIGLVDACRIGGDGYGPVTMQQYNSWNGIVWRNDPDHCDILPVKSAKDIGNVTKTEQVKARSNESIIRPALASIAGVSLLLSDKPAVYENDNVTYGLKRAAPVLFSVPGQLYDFDPSKTDWLVHHDRTDIKGGADPAPSDGDQFGKVCPYWLNEYNTAIDHWNVFHILNWSDSSTNGNKMITFKELGLDPSKEYLVYEFWSNIFLGVIKNGFRPKGLEPYGIQSFAIRERVGHPQLVSTNRHLSQGAVDIEQLRWNEHKTIVGRSKVIAGDQYVMSFYVPKGFTFNKAFIDGKEAKTQQTGSLLRVIYLPEKTASLGWKIIFE